jgi:Flp pilus assembly protein TadG
MRMLQRPAAALVEMAILLPLVIFLFVVAVDFCRVFNCTQTVRGCAEAAALYASNNAHADPSVSVGDAARAAAVAEGTMLNPPMDGNHVSVTVAGGTATVTVHYSFRTLVGYPGVLQPLLISRTIQMPVAPRVGE